MENNNLYRINKISSEQNKILPNNETIITEQTINFYKKKTISTNIKRTKNGISTKHKIIIFTEQNNLYKKGK